MEPKSDEMSAVPQPIDRMDRCTLVALLALALIAVCALGKKCEWPFGIDLTI